MGFYSLNESERKNLINLKTISEEVNRQIRVIRFKSCQIEYAENDKSNPRTVIEAMRKNFDDECREIKRSIRTLDGLMSNFV